MIKVCVYARVSLPAITELCDKVLITANVETLRNGSFLGIPIFICLSETWMSMIASPFPLVISDDGYPISG